MKGSRVVGIEVKGSRGIEPSISQVYVGLGEAQFYLINPLHFRYRGKELEGGIFDEVYLLLPRMPRNLESILIELIRGIGVIGLTTLECGMLVEPKPNPYLNKEKKEIVLDNVHVLERYRFRF